MSAHNQVPGELIEAADTTLRTDVGAIGERLDQWLAGKAAPALS